MKVAVIGSGVSGLAATWLLNEHSDHQVHLYEADSRPGGHANTVLFTPPDGRCTQSVPVDTGFIVFNPITYPNFLHFLKLYPHNAKILPAPMTFSFSRDGGVFEWAAKDLSTVFTSLSRVFDLGMWRLIYDVFRFNVCSTRLLMDSRNSDAELSIGEYLKREGYSQIFIDNYLIPITASIWSTPPDTFFLDFPARTLIQFMYNHELLRVTGESKWLTIDGGSRQYVDIIMSRLPQGCFHPSSPVTSVHKQPQSKLLQVCTADGSKTEYDHVIFACHSDTALHILKNSAGATTLEKDILGSFRWTKNEVILHSDTKLMPRQISAWSSWNYLASSYIDKYGTRRLGADKVSVTFNMNILQHIPAEKFGPVLVTLDAPFEPDPAKVVGRYRYDHPVLDHKAVLSQQRMSLIQGTRGITYAGAYLRYGFHEDGFTSGLRAVVQHIPGVNMPFKLQTDSNNVPNNSWAARIFDVLEWWQNGLFARLFARMVFRPLKNVLNVWGTRIEYGFGEKSLL